MKAVAVLMLSLMISGFAPAGARADSNPDAKLAMHLVASDEYLYCDDLIASACSGIDPDLSMAELAASGYQAYAVFLAYDLETCITGVEYLVTGWPTGPDAPAFEFPEYCPPMEKTLCMGEPFEALGGAGGICAFGECVWEAPFGMAPYAYIWFDLSSHTPLLPITLDYAPSTYTYSDDPHNYVLGPGPDFPEQAVMTWHGCSIGGGMAYQDIQVVSPNGGETWCVGETRTVEWFSFNVTAVRIELSSDGGSSWDLITSSTPASGSHAWTVSDVESENCLIRVSDADDGVPSDVSDGPFTVGSEPTVTVLAPNGGETWQAYTRRVICWTSTCLDAVRLECSTDGGTTWGEIADVGSSPGAFEWIIPDEPSENCFVRITDLGVGGVSDESDGPFTITAEPTVTVLAPNGGEVWCAGETRDIEWASVGVAEVRIEFSTDGGTTWGEIAQVDSSPGVYEWGVPDEPSEACFVRITDLGVGGVSDESDGPFTITAEPSVTVLTPNGGEAWCAGETRDIEWTSVGVAEVRIEFSPDGGSTWDPVASSAPGSGSHSWTVSGELSEDCLIRISDAADGGPFDVSDGPFAVVDEETLTLLAPNGGETWYAWSTAPVRWTWTCVENVRIEYTSDGGSTWTEVVASTPSSGSYAWIVPDAPSGDCLVRVSDAVDGYPSDTSDAPFTIAPQNPLPGAKFAMHVVASDEYLGCNELMPADVSAINHSVTMGDLITSGYCGYVAFVAYDLTGCITGVEYRVAGWPTGRAGPRFSGPTYCPSAALCMGQPFEALGGEGGICAFGTCEWNPEGSLHAFSFIFFDLSLHTDYLPIFVHYAPSCFSFSDNPQNYVLGGTVDYCVEWVVEELGCTIGRGTPVRTSPTTWGGLKARFREGTK